MQFPLSLENEQKQSECRISVYGSLFCIFLALFLLFLFFLEFFQTSSNFLSFSFIFPASGFPREFQREREKTWCHFKVNIPCVLVASIIGTLAIDGCGAMGMFVSLNIFLSKRVFRAHGILNVLLLGCATQYAKLSLPQLQRLLYVHSGLAELLLIWQTYPPSVKQWRPCACIILSSLHKLPPSQSFCA